jgi:hypothetical protein
MLKTSKDKKKTDETKRQKIFVERYLFIDRWDNCLLYIVIDNCDRKSSMRICKHT